MDSQVEQVKAAVQIEDLVREYVPSLKSKGKNWFGLCPFHQEKSPSFSVNPELQIYKCFGCGVGGDVIDFIERIEGVDFPQALEIAAKRAGITLEQYGSGQDSKFRKKQERAREVHRLAAEYYHFILNEHDSGKSGRTYALEHRGLTPKQLKQYKLGYAPENFHNLDNFLKKRGFSRSELVEFGLLVSKNGRTYDKFRGRLMHPIFDLRGNVIAFSGRVISKDTLGPKYLNTPETIIYSKKNSLYGALQAKEEMRRKNYCIVVEGNLDVVSSARADINNIVCPLGTALTIEQLNLLKRYVDTIYFCFDTDQAGKKALLRSLELAEKVGLNALAIDLGDFQDADEMISQDPKLWKQSVESALEVPEYIMTVFKKDYDLSKASDKINYLNVTLPFIAKLRDQIKIDHYLQQLEMITGTRYETLVQKLNQTRQQPLLAENQSRANPDQVQVDAGDTDLPQLEEKSDAYQIGQKLCDLLNYIYAWREYISDVDKLRRIYGDSLPNEEVTLIEMAILGAENKSAVKVETAKGPELKKALITALSQSKIKFNQAPDDPEKEINKMMRSYVRQKLQSYLRVLQASAKASIEETEQQQLLKRISKYISKLEQLGV
jgi:DNA primase